MTEFSGLVVATKQRDKTYSIRIGEKWYSGFETCPADKGDYVKGTYRVNGNFNNIDTIEKTEKEEKIEKQETIVDKGFSITKTNIPSNKDSRRELFLHLSADLIKNQEMKDWTYEDISTHLFMLARSIEKEFEKW